MFNILTKIAKGKARNYQVPNLSRLRIFRLFVVLLWCMVFVAGAEIGLRMIGYYPLSPKTTASILSYPKAFEKDPLLGWHLVPGTHRFAPVSALAQETTGTILNGGHRVTRPPVPPITSPHRPKLIFLGDSFTFGDGLNDNETYPWVVQELLPDFEVLNLAVPGYGTCQVYLQLLEYSKTHPLNSAIIIYGMNEFHERRNRPDLRIAWEFSSVSSTGSYFAPSCDLDSSGKLITGPVHEFHAPALSVTRHSSLIRRFLQSFLDGLDFFRNRQHQQLSFKLLEAIHSLSEQKGARFILLMQRFKGSRKEYLDFLSTHGIGVIDGSHPQEGLPEMQLLGDRHPNAEMNRIWGLRIAEALKERK